MILGTVIFGTKLKILKKSCLHHQEVTDVIIGKQKVQVEARLDIGLKELDAHRVALILIRINEGILLALIVSLL